MLTELLNFTMTMSSARRSMLIVIWATTFVVPSAMAQGKVESGHSAPSATNQEQVNGNRYKYRLPEAEFVGSPSFRSASLVQPLWRDIGAEGHYFGGEENNIGFVGGSWTFHGESWKLAPDFGVSFGDNGFRTMPALSFRWAYEHSWFVSEGLYVQGLLHTTLLPEGTESDPGQPAGESVVPSIADGDHVSARWKRFTAGGTWEHMQFREGREWKGGVRVAYRVLPALSFTFFAMGPGTEI
jgi:hypothetical protein